MKHTLSHFTQLYPRLNLHHFFRRAQQPTRGEQDGIDLISYAGLKELPDHIEVDGRYVRCLFISGYPLVASSGWMSGLSSFSRNADISYHMEVVDPSSALRTLQRKITELESTRRAMIRNGKIVSSETTDPLDSAIELRDKIQRGQEKLFHLSVYVALSARSLKELDAHTTQLEAELSGKLFFMRRARYQQHEALQSILPRGDDQLKQRRNLDSSSLALTFPLVSSELVHESGILYGTNTSNNSLVILDRFSLINANSITFAQSGSGKSYTMKVEILRQLMQGTHVIVIDPEREYQQLAHSLSASYVSLSTTSKEKINPFDLATSAYGTDDLAQHIQDLTEIISLMAHGLDERESAAVDSVLLAVFSESDAPPLLSDIYAELRKRGHLLLCERLEKYISGSLATVFNSQTTIDLTNRLVVFDIKDLPESLRQIMMMIIANYVSHHIAQQPKKRMLVIDEAWLLLEHEQSARFISGLVRRARKQYLGVALISQQATDFLRSDHGRAIASQSSLRILMRQDTTSITEVRAEFHLSEYESNFLLTCGKGEALLIADQHHVAVRIIASDNEHPLITTHPAELYG